MNNKEFKKLFGATANTCGFDNAFGGWLKESSECIAVLDLQKSNFGDYYELNIKIFIQGMLGAKYLRNKYLVKNDTGDIFIRQPDNDKTIFDLEISIDDRERQIQLERLFIDFIVPFTDKALSKSGIKTLAQSSREYAALA